MYVDFKVTIWERVSISCLKNEFEIIEKIKSGELTSSEDLFNAVDSDTLVCDTLYDTAEQMSPSENDDQSTIEVCDTAGKPVWNNAK